MFNANIIIIIIIIIAAVVVVIIIISQTANPTGKAKSYESKGTSRENNPVRKGNYEERGQTDNNNKKNKLCLSN